MTKIGFIDYYLSEWHANNYPGWIREICEKEGLDFELSYAWAEEEISPVDGKTTDEWCTLFGAERVRTIEELCEKSDVIFILAPSNPEKHLPYAKKVFPYGKLTYIDKTFSDNAENAKGIFHLAKQYGTPFFSSSALRYADELSGISNPKSLLITGGGSNITEYSIHLIEILVKLTGIGAFTEVTEYSQAENVKPCNEQRILRLCGNERTASLIYEASLGYQVTADGVTLPVISDFFKNFLKDVLFFFKNGTPSFDVKETLEVMALRDACLRACDTPDTPISIIR